MAFYKNPIIEEPPKCIVCDTVMYDRRWEDGLLCSATCADIWLWREEFPSLREQLGMGDDPEEVLYA